MMSISKMVIGVELTRFDEDGENNAFDGGFGLRVISCGIRKLGDMGVAWTAVTTGLKSGKLCHRLFTGGGSCGYAIMPVERRMMCFVKRVKLKIKRKGLYRGIDWRKL